MDTPRINACFESAVFVFFRSVGIKIVEINLTAKKPHIDVVTLHLQFKKRKKHTWISDVKLQYQYL